MRTKIKKNFCCAKPEKEKKRNREKKRDKRKKSKIIVGRVPGSKSITNRALLIAALADGRSHLKGALFSDDSRYFLQSLQSLGFDVEKREQAQDVFINGLGGKIPKDKAEIYVGSAGTAARFLAALLGISEGSYTIQASEQMQKRPMAALFETLEDLGAQIVPLKEEGFLPVVIGKKKEFTGEAAAVEKKKTLMEETAVSESKERFAQEVVVNIEKSSQFLSALLIVSPLFEKGLTIHVEGSHGMAYIEMTVSMMKQFGVDVQRNGTIFYTAPGQHYHAMEYEIEPDISSACYFYALAPLFGKRVMVKDVHMSSIQGDLAFLSVLEKMGAVLSEEDDGIVMEGTGVMSGVKVDLSACSDQAITLAAIAPFADGSTEITGIGHIRFQESDRLTAIRTELTRMGILCKEIENGNGLVIYPGTPRPCLIETYEDHRMAMGFSLTAMAVEGMVIDNPDCCAKTFAHYFQAMDRAIYGKLNLQSYRRERKKMKKKENVRNYTHG